MFFKIKKVRLHVALPAMFPQNQTSGYDCDNDNRNYDCKNDRQMFCSKCVLKHTEMKHDVIPISPKIEEMKKMIEEMVLEVEKHDQSISVNEELYNKLEMKVRKKFNEEVDKLEKSFRRIMD